jgi:CRP-like cAMP-binding protein
MKPSKRTRWTRSVRPASTASFDVQDYLESAGGTITVKRFGRGQLVFSQGDASGHVMYIQWGAVKLSTVSQAGREAVVAMLGSGDFFGEGCLAGQPLRMSSATALTSCAILRVTKGAMARLLREQPAMSDRFIAYMLGRNIRIEEDLIDQLFNSSEKRLASALLLLARYGQPEQPARVVPKITQEALAEMVGTTRSRVSFFLNKFKTLGFIDYDGKTPFTINSSLLSVVLHD